jgi:FkbM family methyltransferase
MVSLNSFRTGLDVIIALKRPQDYLLSFAGLKNVKKVTLRDGAVFYGKEWYFMYPVFSVMREYGNIGELSKAQKGLTIVDLGAHIGSFSILAARRFPDAKIYSYEPNSENFSYLDKNIRANHLQKRITAIEKAVSSKRGKLTFYGDCVSCSSQRKTSGETNKKGNLPQKQIVSTITLEDIFKNNKLQKIDFLKMDCEGSEFEIFYSSSDQILKKIKLISLEYHEWNGRKLGEIIDRLESCGFIITKLSKGPAKGQGIIHARQV